MDVKDALMATAVIMAVAVAGCEPVTAPAGLDDLTGTDQAESADDLPEDDSSEPTGSLSSSPPPASPDGGDSSDQGSDDSDAVTVAQVVALAGVSLPEGARDVRPDRLQGTDSEALRLVYTVQADGVPRICADGGLPEPKERTDAFTAVERILFDLPPDRTVDQGTLTCRDERAGIRREVLFLDLPGSRVSVHLIAVELPT